MSESYGYQLHKQKKTSTNPSNRYTKSQLELMTTYHLQEICRQEKLTEAMVRPLDKDQLIRLIMRFRGLDDHYLIKKWNPEGFERLQWLVGQTIKNHQPHQAKINTAQIYLYEGLAITPLDQLIIQEWPGAMSGNVLLVSHEQELCGIFNLEHRPFDQQLYLTKDASQICHESMVKDYALYLVDEQTSRLLYAIYTGEQSTIPDHLDCYPIPVLNLINATPPQTTAPLVIDFGSSDTVCGIYLDQSLTQGATQKNQKEGITYVQVPNPNLGGQYTPLIPTLVAIAAIEGKQIHYQFGYDALSLAQSSYIDQNFPIIYDLKNWMDTQEVIEELTDYQGNRAFISRGGIIKAYLQHIITLAQEQFKCQVTTLHFTYPGQQKQKWLKIHHELWPEYTINQEEWLDETLAVLYNTIYNAIETGHYQDGQHCQGLVMDCGGSGSNLVKCAYTIANKRVSYHIAITTSYENGDRDISGNHLTYRIMQLIKILIAREYSLEPLPDRQEIMAMFQGDIYRQVDQRGLAQCYSTFEAAYHKAEDILPTQFAKVGQQNKADYYKVKNNFYFLFELAQEIKHKIYKSDEAIRLVLSTEPLKEAEVVTIPIDKWKLTIMHQGKLETMKHQPTIYLNSSQISQILKADIYHLVKKYLDTDFQTGQLSQYDIFKLTGQSSKIPLFREAIKEFIPGKVLNFSAIGQDPYKSKLECVQGALKYLNHQKMGYSKITLTNQTPSLPFMVTAFTHDGLEQTLIYKLDREKTKGHISRNMAHIALKLHLKDSQGQLRHTYTHQCQPDEFRETTYESLAEEFGDIIPQDDTDNITEGEIKCFIWADPGQWGFYVLPLLRDKEQLKIGPKAFYPFENEEWVTNFFDGSR